VSAQLLTVYSKKMHLNNHRSSLFIVLQH